MKAMNWKHTALALIALLVGVFSWFEISGYVSRKKISDIVSNAATRNGFNVDDMMQLITEHDADRSDFAVEIEVPPKEISEIIETARISKYYSVVLAPDQLDGARSIFVIFIAADDLRPIGCRAIVNGKELPNCVLPESDR